MSVADLVCQQHGGTCKHIHTSMLLVQDLHLYRHAKTYQAHALES